MPHRLRHLATSLLAVPLLAACIFPPPVQVAPAPPPAPPLKVSAVGHGSLANHQYGQYSQGQQKQMAMRAARLDAYRNLAEQIHGFQLAGATTISAFASQNDYVRVTVDAFVQGARVIDVVALPDGRYEARVEALLPPGFRECLVAGNCPQPPKPIADCEGGKCEPVPACVGAGCTPASGAHLGRSGTP